MMPLRAEKRFGLWLSRRGLVLTLALVCLLGAGLRLDRAEELLGFNGDQGRDVTIVQRMIETGQPALLGPGSGIGGFQRGPAYYYLLLPAMWLGGGEPLSVAVFIALVDIGCIVMVFIVGRALISTDAGLVAAALYACAQVPLHVARAMSNPALLPFFTLVMVYSLWRMIQGQERFLVLLVGAWLVAWQLHDQVWLLIPLFGVVGLFFEVRVRRRTLVLAAGIALLVLTPFLWYEATHAGSNVRAMLDYVRSAGAERAGEVGIGGAPLRVWETLWILGRAFAAVIWLHVLWVAAVLMSWLVLLRRVRYATKGAQLLFLYTLPVFLYAFWPGPIYEVNVAIVIPLPFLLVGYGFDLLVRNLPHWRYLGVGIACLLALLNGYVLYEATRARQPGFDSYITLRRVIALMRQGAGDEPFALDYIENTRNEEFASPLYYLLKRAGAVLTTDPEALRFRVFYPVELGAAEPGVSFNSLKVSGYLPPRPYGKNLLSKSWSVRVENAATTRIELNADEIALETHNSLEQSRAVQRLALKSNAVYLLRFECRNALRRGEQRVVVQALDEQGERVETFPNGGGFVCPPTTAWTRGAILIETPADAARGMIWLRNQGEGTVWFRNLNLQRAVLESLPLFK